MDKIILKNKAEFEIAEGSKSQQYSDSVKIF